MNKPKLYIIPGLGETTRMKNYSEIIKFAKQQDFEIVPIKVVWSADKDADHFIKQIEKQIPDNSENDYILGFSIGAYILYILSQQKNFKGYIFCTISPFFKENLEKIPQETKDYFGKKMMKSFAKNTFSKGNQSKAQFLVGDKDWKLAIDTAKKAYKEWEGKKKLIIVKEAGHELSHKKYSEEVKKIIKML